MKPGIYFKKTMADDDMVELEVKACNGISQFTNRVFVGHNTLEKTLRDLNILKDQIHDGTYDLQFGVFGPEYGGGAFHARLHFYGLGKGHLYISTQQETSHESFKNEKVADAAQMHLKTEPALFDNFIREFSALISGNKEEANLICLTSID